MLAAEADPDARPFITPWSREQHERALRDPDQAHLIVVDQRRAVGFILLAGQTGEHRSIELRRIVVSPRGRGIGRRALLLVLDHAFASFGAHRVWLDVKVHNERARSTYASVGFVEEGVLREALRVGTAYESLVIMSILEHEWRAPARE